MLGIPTVALRVGHDLTMKERMKRKRKTTSGPRGVSLPWYEVWAEGENLRGLTAPIDP